MDFGLRVSKVRVRGFRALTDLTLDLERGLTVLVGENNSGKTSFLEAVAIALGRRRPRVEDLQVRTNQSVSSLTVDLRIEPATGDEFPEDAAATFGDAVRDLTGEPYVALRTQVEFDETRGEVRSSRWYLRDWDVTEELLDKPRPGEQSMALLSFEMLDARRDVLEQLRNKSSLLGRTLSAEKFSDAVREEVEGKLKDVALVLRRDTSSLAKLEGHLESLRSTLPGSVRGVEVDPVPQSLKDIVRAVDIRVQDQDWGTHSASVLGMGTRSLAALLVFRTFLEVALAAIGKPESSVSLAAFEEPEAHLHPQAQRAVVRTLRDMPGQVLVSSHSGEIVGQAEVPSIRVFRREGGGVAVRADTTAVAGDSEASILRRRLLLGSHASALFARVVIVVEGATEGQLLPVLADKYWADASGPLSLGIEVLAVGGAGNAKHVIPTLERWGVPWYLVVDGDDAGRKSVAAVGKDLARAITVASDEVVSLEPQLEGLLVASPGVRDLVFAVGGTWPDGSIEEWKNLRHGTKLPKNQGNRDYQSDGWEDRLATDWLLHHKGVVGAPLGRAMVEGDLLPEAFMDLFERVDRKLGRIQ